MINIDAKNEIYQIKGDLPTRLAELEFIVADLYISMLGHGFYNKDINDLFDKVRENGLENAWKVIKLENDISGQELLKDLGVPDVLQ